MKHDEKIPCIDCLCLPICRNIPVEKIFRKCSILVHWFDPSSNDADLIAEKVSGFVNQMRPYLEHEEGENNDPM